MRLLSLATAFATLASASIAFADDDVAGKLSGYESEARALGTDLPALNKLSGVADNAVSSRPRSHIRSAIRHRGAAAVRSREQRNRRPRRRGDYYLAESLYQKGDKARRTRTSRRSPARQHSGRFYQPSLVRLIELAIVQQDDSNVTEYMSALDRAGTRSPSVPYVKGKYDFAHDKHDDAIARFAEVPKGSDYELQALFYTARRRSRRRISARRSRPTRI